MALRNRSLGPAAQDMLQERPKDLLDELIGVALRQLGVLSHAFAVLPRRMRAATPEMLEQGRVVRAHCPWLLNWTAALPTALANKAICAAIKEDFAKAPVLNVMFDLWLFPEPAGARPLEGDGATALGHALRQDDEVLPELFELST